MSFNKVNVDDFFSVELSIDNSSNKGMTDKIKKMEIGDMFEHPIKKRNGISQFGLNLGMKLKTKKIDDDTIAVVRVA